MLITGAVHDPADAPIQGATVQLTIDGVPSTVATTGANGGFSLHAQPGAGVVTVEVVPPVSTGLPRLTASSDALDVKMPLQIRYRSSLVRKNLAGLQIVRQGTPLASASVMIVGTLPASTLPAGTVTSGSGAPVDATGDVRVAATTDASGALPSMQVPAAALSVVIKASDDLAIAALDTTRSLPATLEAPSMLMVTTAAAGPSEMLSGAVLDAVPAGALAMAGAPTVHFRADQRSLIALLPPGGHYDLRFRDPLARRAPLMVADVDAAAIVPSYVLPTALQIRGTVKSGTQPLAGAAVQILCDACVGLDRATPMAETTADAAGQFVVAVPDPGTM
jgi:hypothetical protein